MGILNEQGDDQRDGLEVEINPIVITKHGLTLSRDEIFNEIKEDMGDIKCYCRIQVRGMTYSPIDYCATNCKYLCRHFTSLDFLTEEYNRREDGSMPSVLKTKAYLYTLRYLFACPLHLSDKYRASVYRGQAKARILKRSIRKMGKKPSKEMTANLAQMRASDKRIIKKRRRSLARFL